MSSDCRRDRDVYAEQMEVREREYAAWRASDLPGRNALDVSRMRDMDELARIVTFKFGSARTSTIPDAFPAPKRVRLAEHSVRVDGTDAEHRAFFAALELAFEDPAARTLRVIVEADAEEIEKRCPCCAARQWTVHNSGCILALDHTTVMSEPRRSVGEVPCLDCKGGGKYTPLVGPAEDCRTCSGTGRR